MSKYIKVEDLQAFCDNQKDHCITPNDFQRFNHIEIKEPHENWHTGTPTEEGWYLCQTKAYWIVLFFDSILGWVEKKEAPYIEAWQKIEPYRG